MQDGTWCVCSWGVGGGGGGDVRRTIGLCMLERYRVRSGANWGQFQLSSLSALILQLNWMKDILLPSPRREERRGELGGGWVVMSFLYLTNMTWYSTNCSITQIISDLHLSCLYLCQTLVTSSPMPFCDSPSPFFLGNINPDGFYQYFAFLSVLPCLPLLFSFKVHSKSELWSTHDLSDSGLKASCRCVYLCRVEGACPIIY